MEWQEKTYTDFTLTIALGYITVLLTLFPWFHIYLMSRGTHHSAKGMLSAGNNFAFEILRCSNFICAFSVHLNMHVPECVIYLGSM